MPFSRSSPGSRLRNGILIAICLTLPVTAINGLLVYHNLSTLVENHELVAHSHRVQREIDGALAELGCAESAQRGFLLTEQEIYLQLYAEAIDRLALQIRSLRDLTANQSQEHLDSVETLIAGRLQVMNSAIDIRRTQGLTAAIANVADGHGRVAMEEIRRLADGAMEGQETLLQLRSQQSRESALRLLLSFMMATGLTFIPLAGTIYFFSRESAERERADERFRLAVESAPSAMVMVDAQGHLVMVNRLVESMFGYSQSELIGKPVEQLIPLRFRENHHKFLTNYFGNATARPMGGSRDLFAVKKNGEEFPVEIGLNPIKADEGLLVLGSIVDITARKQAEAAIHRLNEDLERRVLERTEELNAANKELEAFSYSISHDLRAPLRAIDGFSRILLLDYLEVLPIEAREHLITVRDSTVQMGRLVDDLLEFSRLSRQSVRRQRVDVESLVRLCTRDLAAQSPARHVEIQIGNLPPCAADAALLKQVWMNLLSNAFKYTGKREKPVIEIGSRTGDTPGKVTYFVRDNGVGFDMQYASRLFGVFQRLHRAEEYVGTGVGLAIVQRIVHRHGGSVWVNAQLDAGATFFFTVDESNSPADIISDNQNDDAMSPDALCASSA